MTRFLAAYRSERAQSLVLVLVFMTVLIGMAAAVLDVGSWYRADRKLQANADAAALAGAQELPESAAAAEARALAYADANDGGLVAANVKFRKTVIPNDTIEVTAERSAPGFFAKLFGLDSVQVRAKAAARAGVLSRAKWAAPIAVDWEHEKLQCKPTPCWGEQTTIDFEKTGPGAFLGSGHEAQLVAHQGCARFSRRDRTSFSRLQRSQGPGSRFRILRDRLGRFSRHGLHDPWRQRLKDSRLFRGHDLGRHSEPVHG
jgi:hypothetical protein